MTTYNIDFSDPLRNGFTIAPGGFNGPGGALANSALRLYGRGALEWGEAVNENQLRILENFNSATPPPFALGGQIWFNTKSYWLETGVAWWRLDPDAPGTWVDITTSVSGGTTGTNTTPPSVVGTYWYTGGSPSGNDAFGQPIKPTTLYRFDSAFAQVAPGWIERTNTTNSVAPVNGVDYPERQLLIWDEFLLAWVSPPVSFVAPFASPPPDPSTGAFWWDITNNRLNVWDGTAWQGVILASGTQPFNANLDMGGFKIENLDTPTNPADAVTKAYADSLASAVTLDATYLRIDGTNTPTADLDMGGFKITNMADPIANQDAATKFYVDDVLASGGGGGGFSALTANTTGTAVTHKPGDIYVKTNATIRIWIAVDSGTSSPPNFGTTGGSDANWAQVFPAQYS